MKKWFLLGGVALVCALAACTFDVRPVVEVNEASVNIGPIIVELPDGGCGLYGQHD